MIHAPVRREGLLYLLHFDRRHRHAGHYLGFTATVREVRAGELTGRGARLMAVIAQQGIGFRLVRLWRGSRADERRLKSGGGAVPLCPICRPRPRVVGYLEELALEWSRMPDGELAVRLLTVPPGRRPRVEVRV